MRDEFSTLSSSLRSSEIAALFKRRYEVPLIPVEYHRRRGQWLRSDDPGPEFLAWLRGSVIEALEGEWWIDSFALPSAEHRLSCEYCRRNFQFFLRRMPAAVAESTCFVLPGGEDSFERGWILLETYIAGASDCFVQDIGLDTQNVTKKLIRGHYRCTELHDAWYLPRLYALNQVAIECRLIEREYSPIRHVWETRAIVDEIDDVMGTSQKGHQESELGFIGDIRRLLQHLVSERFLGLCKYQGMFPQRAGGLLMKTAMHCISACLLSECVKRGWALPLDIDPETVVFACVQEFVCRRRMPVDNATWAIFLHWQFMLGVTFFKNRDVDRQSQERIEHMYEHLENGARFFILDGDFTSLMDSPPATDRKELEDVRSMVAFDSGAAHCGQLNTYYVEGDPPPARAGDALEHPDRVVHPPVRSDEPYERLFSPAGIPTIAAMMNLPLWGCVSFAARCARRVQPFVSIYWPDVPQRHRQTLEECLLLGEGRSHEFHESLIRRLTDAAHDTNDLRSTAGHATANRCYAAISAALVTAYAIKSALAGAKGHAADNASDAALQACMAVEPNYEIVKDIRADYQALHRQSRAARWKDHWLTHIKPAWTFFSEPPAFVDYNQPFSGT